MNRLEGTANANLKSGKIDPKGYAAARNECKNRIDALARKLKTQIPHSQV